MRKKEWSTYMEMFALHWLYKLEYIFKLENNYEILESRFWKISESSSDNGMLWGLEKELRRLDEIFFMLFYKLSKESFKPLTFRYIPLFYSRESYL